MQLHLLLEPTSKAPTEARLALDELAGAVAEPLLDDLRLVVSELVTNAVIHGPGSAPVEVKLHVTATGHVHGEVADRGDGAVRVRESAGEGGGFGLRLLDQVAERWGVRTGSTHVWFELRGP